LSGEVVTGEGILLEAEKRKRPSLARESLFL
jgi:hypothetical protein